MTQATERAEESWIEDIRAGNRRALAKAITCVESRNEEHRSKAQALLQAALPYSGRSFRIGISGTPGVGKSTFIEAFGQTLLQAGKKLAVLAVDPSSPVAGGSIMGDKTRMEALSREANAYIRPSPAAGQLGGVAHATRESMLLCEAAGFDLIIVETVGVGQSEFDVAAMVDAFVVLMQPNAGDELQGIKKGILEVADVIVINKADGPRVMLAEQAKQHYTNALSFMATSGFWQTQVLCCSALKRDKIEEVWQCLQKYYQAAQSTGQAAQSSGVKAEGEAQERNEFLNKRAKQNQAWMEKIFNALLKQKLQSSASFVETQSQLQNAVVRGDITPLQAAQQLLQHVNKQ